MEVWFGKSFQNDLMGISNYSQISSTIKKKQEIQILIVNELCGTVNDCTYRLFFYDKQIFSPVNVVIKIHLSLQICCESLLNEKAIKYMVGCLIHLYSLFDADVQSRCP